MGRCSRVARFVAQRQPPSRWPRCGCRGRRALGLHEAAAPPPPSTIPPPPPPSLTCRQHLARCLLPTTSPTRLTSSASSVWYTPCAPSPRISRPHLEKHHELGVDRQMARLRDRRRQRLRCLGEKLLGGMLLSVLGGSVSFGTTFTTSRARLFHWKVTSTSTRPSRRGTTGYMGAVPASGPSYMEHW